MSHVLILGGTTFDHIVYLDQFPKPLPQTIHQARFHETTGSTGSGKALCLTKLGVPNTLYSVLGDDPYGKHIIKHLQDSAVDFIYDIDPGGTERHINLMNADGNRISIFIRTSSEHPPFTIPLIESQLAKSDLLVLNIIAYCKDLVPLLSNYKKPVWTDLHDYTDDNPYHEPFINAADIIFLSSDNLRDYKSTMQQLISRGKKLVLCTHGKQGSTALTAESEWLYEPALTGFPLVDSNGAGDNYFAGFLYAWKKGKSTRECMQYGTLCAACCIGSPQLVAESLSAAGLEELYCSRYQ
ncbi:MAG: carbohydrate kinase family protein [Sphingobacteriales bacterium]|nr:carbohydrate kinase family protein [Sphingobacteriales bacterium]